MDALHPLFIDWWFAPPLPATLAGLSTVAERDYRRRQAAWPLPEEPVLAWSSVCTLTADELARAGQCLGALLAAQSPPDLPWLDSLPRTLRSWALRTASTQPLPRRILALPAEADDMQRSMAALAELSRYLDEDFPGLWPRLRAELHPECAAQVDALRDTISDQPTPPHQRRRALRCWQLAVGMARQDKEAP